MEETSWEKTDEQSGDSLIHIVQPQLKQHRAEMNSPCFPNYKFVSKINCGCYFIHLIWGQFQFSHSVMSDSLWPHEPSTPGLPVHHQLPESTQTHAHWMDKEVVVCIHNGLLLSYKKEHICVGSNEMDETGAYYTEWSKPEEKHQYSILTHIYGI